MAAYEDSYKSQLQGVSQQVARERLDGQVSEQINMLSDAVTNLRRRPGAQFAFALTVGSGYTAEDFAAWDTVVGGLKCQVILNADSGVLRVLGEDNTLLYTSAATPYLQATAASAICTATIGDSLYFANTSRKPLRGAYSMETATSFGGFFYIRAGAFNKKYTVTVSIGTPTTFTYTTPNGTAAGDADLTTAEYIANALKLAINAAAIGVTAYVLGAYVFIKRGAGTDVTVTTEAGLSYIVASNVGYIRQESDLPAKLPADADGWLVATGDARTKRFYRYNAATQSWLEAGDLLSPLTLTNTPIALTRSSVGVWALDVAPFEGRFAGDDSTNPDPEFVNKGITGMAAYQGRLVLLAGNIACLSASNLPRRFYRSTVASLLDSDAIGIGATGAAGATYRYAVPYQKDLLLFSEKNQAVIPGSTVAVTPRTAAVLPTSDYAADMAMKPLVVGRGLLFSAPRSSTHFGMLEMLPSNQVDGLYVSTDATAHLPEYMSGRCRFSVSSTVSNMAVFAPSAEPNVLIVHEYIWSEEKKVQQSWHRWEFPFPIATAYFSGANIVLLFLHADTLVGCTVEPQGSKYKGADWVPYLDLAVYVPVVSRSVTLPAWLAAFAPADVDRLKLRMHGAQGDLAGQLVGHTYAAGAFTTVLSYPTGRVAVGFPFLSSVTPTPPMRKDYQGVKISTNKMTVLRFAVGTNESGPFDVSVGDGAVEDDNEDTYSPVYFYSRELAPGQPIVGADSTVVVPARTRAENTVLTMSTDGASEFNLVGLEFVAQYHEKLRRASK